jgi:hypothetical protein
MEHEWCDAVSPWQGKVGERVRRVCAHQLHDETVKHSWEFPTFRGPVVVGPDEDPERAEPCSRRDFPEDPSMICADCGYPASDHL